MKVTIQNIMVNEFQTTPRDLLHIAIRVNSLDLVEALLTQGVDPNQRDSWNRDPIESSQMWNRIEILSLLKSTKVILINN